MLPVSDYEEVFSSDSEEMFSSESDFCWHLPIFCLFQFLVCTSLIVFLVISILLCFLLMFFVDLSNVNSTWYRDNNIQDLTRL